MSTIQQSPPVIPAPKKRHVLRNTLIGLGAFVVVGGVATAMGGQHNTVPGAVGTTHAPTSVVNTSAPAHPVTATQTVTAATTAPVVVKTTPAKVVPTRAKAPPAPEFTVSQQNAIKSAQSYLEMSGFSRAGLIDQLSSSAGEGFPRADAVFAVNHIKVDWNKEAVESAKSYLSTSSFSRSGLIEQLTSQYGEQFTLAQATYAVNHVGL